MSPDCDPEGGKTTTLLKLAKTLLERARNDDYHPIPVVFNLSAWYEKRGKIEDWLVDSLRDTYQVAASAARDWVHRDQLLLLDGLDEVVPTHREACIEAINQYRETHPFVGLVLCSRTEDYNAMESRLYLNGAVIIQPLDDEAVNQYLAKLGASGAGIKALITGDLGFRELSGTPLMLNIMTMAYQHTTVEELPISASPESRHQHLFDTYTQRMLERSPEPLYTSAQTIHYLRWLASTMYDQGQVVF
jgi:hypothetical protein